jgi:rubrerythrin
VTPHTVSDGDESTMEESMVLSIDFSRLDAQDVLDLAIHVEEEAEDNYEQLATWMTADDNHEVAAFFTKMAGLERRHRDQLADRRRQLYGEAPPRHSARAVWEVEQPDYDALGDQVSMEHAFELAMSAERQAGEYYGTALEYASDQQVIALFRDLKKAEEEHLRLLSEQRAKALRAETDDST